MSLKVNINNIHLKLQCDSDSDKEGSPSNLRKNAFKALQEIEAEFLKFKDILIEDKLREIEKEIDMLNNSNLLNCLSSSISKSDYFNFEHDVKLTPTELSQFNSLNEQSGNIQQENLQHPLYLKKLKLLELKKMEKFQILEQERKCKLRNVSNKFEEEQLSIRCTYKEQIKLLRKKNFNLLFKRLYKLKREYHEKKKLQFCNFNQSKIEQVTTNATIISSNSKYSGKTLSQFNTSKNLFSSHFSKSNINNMHSADDLKLKKLKQQKTQYLIEYKKILNDNSIYQNNIKFFPSAELNLFLDKKDINEDLESLGLRGQKLKKENLELFNQQQHVQNNTNSIHSSHISTSSSLQNMSTQLQKQQKLQNQLSSLQQQPQQQQQKQYITLPSPTAIFDHQHQLPLPNGILLNKGDLIQFQDVYTRFQCKVLGWSQGEVWLGRLSDGSKKRLTYSNVIEGKVLLTPL